MAGIDPVGFTKILTVLISKGEKCNDIMKIVSAIKDTCKYSHIGGNIFLWVPF